MSDEPLGEDARPFIDEDLFEKFDREWVMDYLERESRKLNKESEITQLVHDEVAKRHRVGMETHLRPLMADTYDDPLQEAIEEVADALFYLVCLREKLRG